MAKHDQATQAKTDETKSRPKSEPANSAGLTAFYESLPGFAGDGTIARQAARLADQRLSLVQRRAMVTQIGQVQGNNHLQKIISSQAQIVKRPQQSSTTNAGAIQRALPGITEPSVSAVSPQNRTQIDAHMETYRESPSIDNGQAAIESILDAIDPGMVQYRNQADIRNSPIFRDAPSDEATEAARRTGTNLSNVGGFTYPGTDGNYRVEIYRSAFLAGASDEQRFQHVMLTLIHEFVHILQGRREAGTHPAGEEFSSAHREFQAWLLQGEQAIQLGIQPGTPPYNQINTHLNQFYNQLPTAYKNNPQLKSRYALVVLPALIYQINAIRLQGFIDMGAEYTQGRRDRLQELFQMILSARRSTIEEDYNDARRLLDQADQQRP
jgi:hypothetical protein